jgi:plasmid stabilization system protein ParE
MAEPAPRPILVHPLARKEYWAARRWYRRRSAWAEQHFADAVRETLNRIAASPMLGQVYVGSVLWKRTPRFPYLLIYLPSDSGQITIIAVAHGRRRKGYWMRRLRP